MTWQQVIQEIQIATLLISAVDPGTTATVDEVAALEKVASDVLTAIAAQKNSTIDEVIVGLNYEDPTV